MNTRCEICMQPATKKCTGCGKVFCDLHIRLGGQANRMYSNSVGYYCDDCWETRSKRKKTRAGVLMIVAILLLALNMWGRNLFQTETASSPGVWMIIALIGGAILGLGVWKSRF